MTRFFLTVVAALVLAAITGSILAHALQRMLGTLNPGGM